jgi:TonB family protein
MKTTAFLITALALSATGLNAQPGAPPPERQSLVIHQKMMPLYPRDLLEAGVNTGSVRIVIDVDRDGFLSEWLVVGYSHREFANAVETAIRRWEFEPMRVNGDPVASQVEVLFEFDCDGAVVSLVGSAVSPSNLIPSMNNTGGEWIKSMQDLDRIPMPLVTVPPIYSFDLRDKGVTGEAVVEFYIDKNGTVRMPAVLDSDFIELGALALHAVEQWSFEPATVKGRPVLVKARQVFHFGDNDL